MVILKEPWRLKDLRCPELSRITGILPVFCVNATGKMPAILNAK
jgi:hypothetical protein